MISVRRLAALVAALALATLGLCASPAFGAANLTITPVTWDVVGLDSNSPGTGPKNFPVGAKVCNSGNATATGAATAFAWTTSNANITLQSSATDALADIPAGGCATSYYTIEVNRIRAAFDTSRKYTITATATGGLTATTPTNRQIYVEHLVSQNRNTTFAITGAAGCTGSTAWLAGSGSIDFTTACAAPVTAVSVGSTYTMKLYAQTSTTYEQVEPFVTFPGTMFRVESVKAEFQSPTGTVLSTPYANACGWNPVVGSANYLSCTGPPQISGGKAGNRMIVTYQVTVVGAGSGALQSLIYDFSGSSFHYNADFSTASITTFTAKWPLTTAVVGSGTVTSNTGGINCGVTCEASYADQALVTLTATPSGGQTFTGWSGNIGACSPTATTCTLTMNQARSVTATFSGPSLYYPLSTTVIGDGMVTSDIAGINCDPDCDETYAAGTSVALTASPGPGQSFIGWTGDTTGCTPVTGPPATLACPMSQARNVTATFATVLRTLTVNPPVGATITGPGGLNCTGGAPDTGTCSATFPDGTAVTLTTTPDPGYRVTDWTSPCAGSAATTCSFTLSADATVGSTVASGYVFSGTVIGGGTIVSALPDPGIDCPGTCDYGFVSGTPLLVQATAATGWSFAGWSGPDCPGSGSGSTCVAFMTANRAGTATFNPILGAAVIGGGSVTSSTGGVNCPGGACTAVIPTGTSVTLTATPAPGWTFSGWTGDCAGETTNTCTDSLTGPQNSTALFDPDLTTEVTGNGTISSPTRSLVCNTNPCANSVPYGTTVTLVAMPGPGQVFKGWGGACSGTATTCVVTMDQLRLVTALFEDAPAPVVVNTAVTLTTEVTGSGTVTSSTGGTLCPSTCTESLATDTLVTLTATPAAGQMFTGWGGACTGTAPTCTVTMSQSRNVTATFAAPGTPKLSTTAGTSGTPGRVILKLTVSSTGGPSPTYTVAVPVPPGTEPVAPLPTGVTKRSRSLTWATPTLASGGRSTVAVVFRMTGASATRTRVTFRPALFTRTGTVLRAPAAVALRRPSPSVTG